MPHIHTQPGQHDMTVSAYIIRTDGPAPLLLVHMHKKLGKLMQIGGHIELDETPWQALAHEITEESGYDIAELKVLQPQARPIAVDSAIVHPVPVLMNTHRVSETHYHSDLVYAFTVTYPPASLPKDNESSDLRWLSVDALRQEADNGVALKDVADMYSTIATTYLTDYASVDTALFSLEEPSRMPS